MTRGKKKEEPAAISSPVYTHLVMDEKRMDLVSLVFDQMQKSHNVKDLAGIIRQIEMTQEEWNSFWNHFAEQHHKMGWCKDPFCKWGKGDEKAESL